MYATTEHSRTRRRIEGEVSDAFDQALSPPALVNTSHSPQVSERALIASAKRGSPDAVDELVRRFWRDAFRAALLVTGEVCEAEDVAQGSRACRARSPRSGEVSARSDSSNAKKRLQGARRASDRWTSRTLKCAESSWAKEAGTLEAGKYSRAELAQAIEDANVIPEGYALPFTNDE